GFGATGFEERAVAWVDGEIFDLNTLLEPGTEWSMLVQATGVNDHGDIVGWGFERDGSTKGFVIQGFVPAPGAPVLLAMGAVGLTRRRR
ncbi:MAG: hypothetical protein KDA28_07055, partial [Phycisphaerales bacterium]|nr:hypothetical protein [Phycisphaerales bacterium]